MKGNLILPVLLILSTTGCLDMIEEYLGTEEQENEFDVISSFVGDWSNGKYEQTCSKMISYNNGKFLTEYQERMEMCMENFEYSCGSNGTYCNLSITYEYTFETEYNSNSTHTGPVNHVWTNMTSCIYTDEEGWSCVNERLKWHVMMNLSQEKWGILGVDDGTYQACGENYEECNYILKEEDEEDEEMYLTLQTKVVGDDRAVRVIKASTSADMCLFSWYLKDQMGNTAQFGDTCADEGEESECVTFYDNDSDGDLSAGDQYMVKDGCFGDDYSFDIKHDPSGDIVGSANL